MNGPAVRSGTRRPLLGKPAVAPGSAPRTIWPMANLRGIWHLIEQLDGYGGNQALRYVTAQQAAAGNRVAVAALDADPRIARELTAAGVEVQALGTRWDWDPLALGKLWRLSRKRSADWKNGFVWDAQWRRRMRVWRRWAIGPRRVSAPAVVDVNALPAQAPCDLRAELELDATAPLVATVGPLERMKHIDEAIWCFELVRVLHPSARLVVVGDGLDRQRLERLALAISEPGCVRFVRLPRRRAGAVAAVRHALAARACADDALRGARSDDCRNDDRRERCAGPSGRIGIWRKRVTRPRRQPRGNHAHG